MKANRRKLEIAMANACMSTADLQKATEMPRPTINNVITGKGVRPATIGRVAKDWPRQQVRKWENCCCQTFQEQ